MFLFYKEILRLQITVWQRILIFPNFLQLLFSYLIAKKFAIRENSEHQILDKIYLDCSVLRVDNAARRGGSRTGNNT